MFKFLKLRNSFSWDARRHVPFGSIIHKPLIVFIALVFSFVAIVPIKVNAAAPNITPQFKPILDTDIVNFQDSYLNLDPAAQAAANILFGAYVTEYAGLADYGTVFDEVPTDGTVWDRLEFAGQQLVDTFFLPYNMADQLVLTPLLDLGQGIINKVKNINSVQGFTSDIMSGADYGLRYTPDIGFSLNQVFARSGGLYNWQRTVTAFNTYLQNYETSSLVSAADEGAQTVYLTQNYPHTVRYIYGTNYKLGSNSSYDFFARYHNVFINTYSHTFSLVDDYGNRPGDYTFLNYGFSVYNDRVTPYSGTWGTTARYWWDNYNSSYTLDQVYYRLCFGTLTQFASQIWLSDFVDNVYYGNNWNERILYIDARDLGYTQTESLEVLNPVEEVIFDLKQLVQQIVDAEPAPDYELPLKPIIYNITQVQGSPLTAEDLQGISFNVTPPESGIDIPPNVFLPMFDNGKGFISYMWYMTKPLVIYTRDLLDILIFDPVEGFNASGPGYFVLGVVGLGVIGGVIVKFLL